MLENWLLETHSTSNTKYSHRLLEMNVDRQPTVVAQLQQYFKKAHDDVQRHLRSLVDISLDPLGEPSKYDPAEGYPEKLPANTLKGYMGEVFAGLISEKYSPLGEEWKVPAFLFRFHKEAFFELENWRQTGQQPKEILGRMGSDCLAFQLNDRGHVARSLICEAKCTSKHDAGLITKAHKQISKDNLIPIDILLIIEILIDYDDEESRRWVQALTHLLPSPVRSDYERCDMVCYVHGRSPKRLNRRSWIPTNTPHKAYSGNRRLEAVEVRIKDVDRLLQLVYGTEGR